MLIKIKIIYCICFAKNGRSDYVETAGLACRPYADDVTRKSDGYKYDVSRCIRHEAKTKTEDAAISRVKRMMRGAMDTKTTVELPPVTVVQQVSLQYIPVFALTIRTSIVRC